MKQQIVVILEKSNYFNFYVTIQFMMFISNEIHSFTHLILWSRFKCLCKGRVLKKKKTFQKTVYVLLCEITSSTVGYSITWLIQISIKGIFV